MIEFNENFVIKRLIHEIFSDVKLYFYIQKWLKIKITKEKRIKYHFVIFVLILNNLIILYLLHYQLSHD